MSSYALSHLPPHGQAKPPAGIYSRRRARTWETTKLLLRSLSLTLFLGIFLTNMASVSYFYDEASYLDLWPWVTLIAAGPAFLWDVADLITLWVRRGRAISPKAQIGVELCLVLAAMAGAAVMAWQLSMTAAGLGATPEVANRGEGFLGALLTLMMLTLVVRMFLFVRAWVDRRRELRMRRPRIMYIDALGEAVFVVAKPNVSFGKLAVGAGRPGTGKNTAMSISSTTARDAESLAGTDGLTEVTSLTTLVQGPSQAASVTARQRPLMRPPPDGYEPDEAEMERRRRGDAQPQLMLPEVVDMKFSSNVVVNPREGKFLVESSKSPGVAGESSRSQLRSAPMVEGARGDRPRSWG
ncbi:hypothetical protein ACHAQA_005895 [Verticillium albo-atrum]